MAATLKLGVLFTGDASRAIRATNSLAGALNLLNRSAKNVGKGTAAAQTTGVAFIGTLQSMNKFAMQGVNVFMNMGNAMRLAAQGMMSVGKSMTMFITPVVLLILYKATQAAIDFDDALVRVKKTTGTTRKEIAQIGQGLRNLSTTTATSAVDLAKMAEQVGQMGVKAPKSIVNLTRIFNMLVSATDIAADKVALSMGKIANAFGIDIETEQGIKDIERLSSVINRLENDMEATAPEIQEALLRIAQVGSMLDMPAHTAAAFGTALIAVGFNAEQAGTAIRNMMVKVTENADEVAVLMRNWDKYGSTVEVINEINKDAAGVMIDLIEAAAAGDDAARTLIATFDVAGIRGGKAWAALAGGIDTFRKSLGLADAEWEESLSLIREYEESLLSTKNQLKVLRNNVDEIARVFGDTLLPIINHLIQVAVPGIRKLAEAFRHASPKMKKMVVVGALLLAVAGPLILMFSQVAFGLSMLVISGSRMVQVFFTLTGMILQLALAFLPMTKGIAAFLLSWQGLVAAILIGAGILILKFTGLGEKIATFFLALADKAREWGTRLIAEFGQGILAAAAMVLAKVLTAIGNFIGKFLAGASPPQLGPLSHIGKWGKTLFDEYLKGFLKADFGILSGVGRAIEGILKNFQVVGKLGKGVQFKFAMEAREHLAKLIKVFQETGEVAQELLDQVTRNLGEASDEVQKLIRLWLEYQRIQEELADLEKRRKATLDTYRQEIQLIAQSNMSAEEKADAIRRAMRLRNDELRVLEAEEDALEEQEAIAKEQLETQKAMIAAMQKQDDLQASLINALDKLASKLESLAGIAFPDLSGMIPDDFEQALEDIMEPILTLEERFAQGEKAFDGFFAALKGAPFDETLFAELKAFDEENGTDFANTYQNLWELGNNIFKVWDTISTAWEQASEIFGKLLDFDLNEFGENIGSAAESLDGLLGFIVDNLDTILVFLGAFKILTVLFGILSGLSVGGLLSGLMMFFAEGALAGTIAAIGAAIGSLIAAFQVGGIGFFLTSLIAMINPVTVIIGLIALLVALLITKWDDIVAGFEAWKGIWENIKVIVGEVWTKIKTFFSDLKTTVVTKLDEVRDKFIRIWAAIREKVGEKILEIIKTIKDIPKKVGKALKKLKNEVVGKFKEAWEGAKEKFEEIFGGIIESITGFLDDIKQRIEDSVLGQLFIHLGESIKEAWDEIWTYLQEKIGPIWEEIQLIISTVIERIKTFITEKWEEIKTAVLTKWEEIKTAIITKVMEIVTALTEKWEEVKAAIVTKWEEIKTAISGKWDEIKLAVATKMLELIAVIGEKWDEVKTTVKEKWEGIKNTLAGIWDAIKAVIEAKISPIVEKIKGAWDKIKNRIKIAWAIIRTVISIAWDKIKTTILQKLEDVKNAIVGFKQKFIDAGKNIINGIKEGVVAAAKGLIDKVTGVVQDAINAAKRALGIASESKLFMEIGLNTILGMATGVEQAGSMLGTTFEDTLGGAMPTGLMGDALAPGAPAGDLGGLTLTFNRDSVRSDQDILEITDLVQEVLNARAEDRMAIGTTFGGEI